MNTLTIEAAGPAVTIQDQGRFGWEHCGVTEGGAIDPRAWRLGQRLIGQKEPLAAIEVPWGNMAFRLEDERRIAVTGSPLAITIDGVHCPMNTGLRVPAGALVSLGRSESQLWSYVSVEGGIDTPLVFGSRSTVLREQLGGFEGRALMPGDRLPLGPAHPGECWQRLDDPKMGEALELRFVPSFQYPDLPQEARDVLCAETYRVSARSDRMGARVEGPAIVTGMSRLWSEGTCLGAIQIPPDGQPIVLLNDRQTMGGYPKAGVVLPTDCARLAQSAPGAALRFRAITQEQAQRYCWLQQNFESEQVLAPAPALTMETATG